MPPVGAPDEAAPQAQDDVVARLARMEARQERMDSLLQSFASSQKRIDEFLDRFVERSPRSDD